MSEATSSLSSKCLESLRNGVSIQQEVRKILNTMDEDSAGKHIAEEMGKYRDAADSIISAAPESERKAVQKRANNVINDVSRICREEIKRSIKLVSRKGGYVYRAAPWEPTPKSVVVATSGEDSAEVKRLKEEVAKLKRELEMKEAIVKAYRRTLEDPEDCISEMIDRGATPDDIGHAVVKVMRRVKSADAPEEESA